LEPAIDDQEIALLVGNILRSAFLDDREFRMALNRTNALLEKAVRRADHYLVRSGLQSSFNSHIVSSYHTSRAIELLSDEIRGRPPGSSDLLFSVMHAFALESVLGLQSAAQLFSHAPVAEAMKGRSVKVQTAFASKFPFLRETRDALAHDDERVFAIVRHKERGDAIDQMQLISLWGTRLTCKNEKLEDIEFNFPTASYFELLEEIETALSGK
jgi:hypothetical protein